MFKKCIIFFKKLKVPDKAFTGYELYNMKQKAKSLKEISRKEYNALSPDEKKKHEVIAEKQKMELYSQIRILIKDK